MASNPRQLSSSPQPVAVRHYMVDMNTVPKKSFTRSYFIYSRCSIMGHNDCENMKYGSPMFRHCRVGRHPYVHCRTRGWGSRAAGAGQVAPPRSLLDPMANRPCNESMAGLKHVRGLSSSTFLFGPPAARRCTGFSSFQFNSKDKKFVRPFCFRARAYGTLLVTSELSIAVASPLGAPQKMRIEAPWKRSETTGWELGTYLCATGRPARQQAG